MKSKFLEPSITLGIMIFTIFHLFEMFRVGIIHFFSVEDIFLVVRCQIVQQLIFRPPVTKNKRLPDGPLKIFQLEWFIPSKVDPREGLNMIQPQGITMSRFPEISPNVFSVHPSQKIRPTHRKEVKFHYIFIFQMMFWF